MMGEVYKKIFDMLMESQYWPPEQMLAYQRHQLGQLLQHARANVPFYKTRLDPVFRPNGDIDWGRWHEIPIVSRADVRDRGKEMAAIQMPPGHGKVAPSFTSGSSGTPISISKNELFRAASRVAGLRFRNWAGLDCAKTMADFPAHFIPDVNDAPYKLEQTTPMWQQQKPGPKMQISRNLAAPAALQLLREFNIRYVTGQPYFFDVLAHANLELAKPIKPDVSQMIASKRRLTCESRIARSLRQLR